MQTVTFITGNQAKADYLAKYLEHPVEHQKIDLDELQSLDLNKIVEHKVKQAYDMLHSPVLVEDVSLEFEALGGLPGPFIRFFVDNVSPEDICSLVNGKSRRAMARCVFGYFDGRRLEVFEGSMGGKIAGRPAGDGGYGWDRVFIPDGYDVTRASLSEEDDRKTYLQIKPFEKLRLFLKKQL